jgi:hypothetical protein
MPIDEHDVIQGCIDGKRSSQKQLYEHFAGKMLGHALCQR